MTRTLRIGTALFIAGALAACSSLIPDQAIDDAFGLDGVVVTASAGGGATISLDAGPIGSSQVTGTFATEIRSDGFDAIPGFVNVASISDVITIQATVEVSAAGNVAFASSYTITGAAVELVVSNGGSTIIDQSWSASGLDLTFAGSAAYDETTGLTTGTYVVATEVPMITLLAQGAAVNAFVDALGDGDTLDVAGTLTVDLEPAFPIGAEVTFVLKSLGGTLSF